MKPPENKQMDEEEKAEILEKIRKGTGSTLRRVGAYIIDIVVTSLLFIFAVALLQFIGVDFVGIPSEITLVAGGFIPTTPSYLVTLSLFSLIHLFYFVILESDRILGSSLGKKAASLKVVDIYGQGIGFATSLTRNVFRLLWPIPFIFLEILPLMYPLPFPNIAYVFGVIMVIDLILIEKKEQRIGDKVADTYIVHENTYEGIFEDYWKDKGTQDTIEPTPNW